MCSPDSPLVEPSQGPSCNGLPTTCGGGANCCDASVVTGGTFKRSYDAGSFPDPSFPATVSDFRLDVYEVTVGRFRKFVAAYPGNLPTAGAGKNPSNPSDPGWMTSWSGSMPASQAALTSALKCGKSIGNTGGETWTDAPASNEDLPINCVTWYEAYAFCIWDGGRIPSEAEWNYASAGGGGADGQRMYPWSSPPTSTTVDDSYVVFCGGSCAFPQAVGNKAPKGDGKWGQADMGGNVWEWVEDWFASTYTNPCVDCANSTAGTDRGFRGGSFRDFPSSLYVSASFRSHATPGTRVDYIGIRCAGAP
jgi:formylglycine-generating enzyme required for sulfatase activity